MGKGNVFLETTPKLTQGHFDHLSAGSGISTDVILQRGYQSVLSKGELQSLGFSNTQCRSPGILIPLWGVDGQNVGHVYRADDPRVNTRGKAIKYEMPAGSSLRIDCLPRCQKALADHSVSLWITEGWFGIDCPHRRLVLSEIPQIRW